MLDIKPRGNLSTIVPLCRTTVEALRGHLPTSHVPQTPDPLALHSAPRDGGRPKTLNRIQRTAYTQTGFRHHMRVNLCCRHVLVPPRRTAWRHCRFTRSRGLARGLSVFTQPDATDSSQDNFLVDPSAGNAGWRLPPSPGLWRTGQFRFAVDAGWSRVPELTSEVIRQRFFRIFSPGF